ncbi:MAG: polysulfide reductase NrfD [Magnetococcales bacterium]|nr:polysulfide reductase NrfD [Magnetococcales bacterium]
MMETVTFATQNVWTWWFAIYLFLGGMGAASISLAIATDRFLKPHKTLVLWGVVGGVMMLNLGSMILFIHLLHHTAVLVLFTPFAIINQPGAWIAWGTQFIMWVQIAGLLYAMSYLRESTFWLNFPLAGTVIKSTAFARIADFGARFRGLFAWLAMLAGFGTAAYTGLLLQSFPAVTLWHNPAVPVLFTVSAFSTALAYLMLVMLVFIRNREDHALQVLFERTDVLLLALELFIIYTLFNFTLSGSESGYRSATLLWESPMWVVGFLGLGLLLPFLVELRSLLKGWSGSAPMVIACILILNGGYILRHMFMYSGVYAFPW